MSDVSRVSSGPLAARAGWAGGRATCELIRDRLGASSTLPQARRSSFAVGMYGFSSISQGCQRSAPKAVVLHRAVFGSKRERPVGSAAQAIVKAPRRIEGDKRHLAQCVGGRCE